MILETDMQGSCALGGFGLSPDMCNSPLCEIKNFYRMPIITCFQRGTRFLLGVQNFTLGIDIDLIRRFRRYIRSIFSFIG